MTEQYETETAEPKPDFFTEEGFDLFAMLDGTEYPEDVVEVYLNERAAHKSRASKRILAGLDPNDPEQEEKIGNLVDLINGYDDEVEASKLYIHIRGVDSEVMEAVKPVIDEEFKSRQKTRYRSDKTLQPYFEPEVEQQYASALNAAILQLHVTKIVNAKGREIVAPDREYIHRFLKKAPTSQVQKFNAKIVDLQVQSGHFENRLNEDFSPKR